MIFANRSWPVKRPGDIGTRRVEIIGTPRPAAKGPIPGNCHVVRQGDCRLSSQYCTKRRSFVQSGDVEGPSWDIFLRTAPERHMPCCQRALRSLRTSSTRTTRISETRASRGAIRPLQGAQRQRLSNARLVIDRELNQRIPARGLTPSHRCRPRHAEPERADTDEKLRIEISITAHPQRGRGHPFVRSFSGLPEGDCGPGSVCLAGASDASNASPVYRR